MPHPTLGVGSRDLHLTSLSGDSDIKRTSTTALLHLPNPVSSQSDAGNVLGMGLPIPDPPLTPKIYQNATSGVLQQKRKLRLRGMPWAQGHALGKSQHRDHIPEPACFPPCKCVSHKGARAALGLGLGLILSFPTKSWLLQPGFSRKHGKRNQTHRELGGGLGQRFREQP